MTEIEKELKETNEILDNVLTVLDVADLGIELGDIISAANHLEDPLASLSAIKTMCKRNQIDTISYKDRAKSLAVTLRSDSDMLTVEKTVDYIIKNIKYEENNNSMYEFFNTRKGKCWHIAHFFSDLLTCNFVDCKVVKGFTNTGERHVWNAVYIDGDWRYYDLTWYLGGKPDCLDQEETVFLRDHIPFCELLNTSFI